MARTNASGSRTVLDCRRCPTRQTAQWRVLDAGAVEQLNDGKSTATYEAGDLVFGQDSPCEGVHCLAEGSLVLRKTNAQGNSVLIKLVMAGETVGYRSYYNSHQHAEQADALEPSTICLVPNRTLEALLDINSELGQQFATSLADDFKQIEDSLLESISFPVRARIARLLQLLLTRFGDAREGGEILVELPFGRQRMADLLGIQRETVTRALNAMRDDGVLEHSGRQVVLGDLDRLLDEIEGA